MAINITGSQINSVRVTEDISSNLSATYEMGTVRVDGNVVWKDRVIVDDFEHANVDANYGFSDPGQATLPHASTDAAYEKTYGYRHPLNNPNAGVSLAADNPAYDADKQPSTVDRYPGPGDVLEWYWRPQTFNSADNSLFRFMFNSENPDYGQSLALRLHIDPSGYWRIAYNDGTGSDYYGDDPQEDSSFDWDVGAWHRFVVDMSIWPDVATSVWNAETGAHKSSLETTGGDGTLEEKGYGFWGNGDTEFDADLLNIIDPDDYTAGEDM